MCEINRSTKMKKHDTVLICLATVYLLISSKISEVHGACAQYAYPTATEITADGTIQLLQSQNYPDPYLNDQRCQWHVTVGPADSRIIIHVQDFSSEGTKSNCPSKDYATIFDGADDTANEIFRVCPGTANERKVYISSTNEIFVQFRSDAFLTYTGISIAVFTNDSSNQPACSTTLTATSTPQYLLSNNLWSPYAANNECVHTFEFAASDSTNGVQFDVQFVDIETSASCEVASLTISGGGDNVTQYTEYTLCNSSDIFVYSMYTVRSPVTQLNFTTTNNVNTSAEYYGFLITYQTSFDIDECASSPCANGGTCTEGVNSFTCQCAAGYEGTMCNTNTDECASSPCANGGTCTDGVDSFACQCAVGYEGIMCSTETDECASSPCANGGTCADGINIFTCQCDAGYEGTTCNIDTDECASSPCANGGTCTDGVDSFTCQCAAGYEGTMCKIVSTDDDEIPVVAIVIPIAVTFVAVGFFAIIMIYYMNMAKQRKGSTYDVRHDVDHEETANDGPLYIFVHKDVEFCVARLGETARDPERERYTYCKDVT